MCSSRCEIPVTPAPSFREPTLYQTMNETTGALCTSWIRTFRPFRSTVSNTTPVFTILGPVRAGASARARPVMPHSSHAPSPRPPERGHALDVGCVREHVDRLDPLGRVARPAEDSQIAPEGAGVAGDVDQP